MYRISKLKKAEGEEIKRRGSGCVPKNLILSFETETFPDWCSYPSINQKTSKADGLMF
jgi:hypothetical protein